MKQSIATKEDSRFLPADGRRVLRRAHFDAEVCFRTATNTYRGFSENLSTGGLFIATLNLFPVGTLLALSFAFPSGQHVHVDSQVEWIRRVTKSDPVDLAPGLGVRFQQLGPEASEAINEFVSRHTPHLVTQ